MIELVHTSDGQLKAKGLDWDALCTVGTRIKIIKTNPEINVRKSRLGLIGTVAEHLVDYNRSTRKNHNTRSRIYAQYESGTIYCYPDMIEIV